MLPFAAASASLPSLRLGKEDHWENDGGEDSSVDSSVETQRDTVADASPSRLEGRRRSSFVGSVLEPVPPLPMAGQVGYRDGGDAALDTPEARRHRAALRKHRDVAAALRCFTDTFEDSAMDGEGRLLRAAVTHVLTLACKALWPPELFSLAAASSVVSRDWQRDVDAGGADANSMSCSAFEATLFELADLWTDDLQPATYAAFLSELYRSITGEEMTAPAAGASAPALCGQQQVSAEAQRADGSGSHGRHSAATAKNRRGSLNGSSSSASAVVSHRAFIRRQHAGRVSAAAAAAAAALRGASSAKGEAADADHGSGDKTVFAKRYDERAAGASSPPPQHRESRQAGIGGRGGSFGNGIDACSGDNGNGGGGGCMSAGGHFDADSGGVGIVNEGDIQSQQQGDDSSAPEWDVLVTPVPVARRKWARLRASVERLLAAPHGPAIAWDEAVAAAISMRPQLERRRLSGGGTVAVVRVGVWDGGVGSTALISSPCSPLRSPSPPPCRSSSGRGRTGVSEARGRRSSCCRAVAQAAALPGGGGQPSPQPPTGAEAAFSLSPEQRRKRLQEEYASPPELQTAAASRSPSPAEAGAATAAAATVLKAAATDPSPDAGERRRSSLAAVGGSAGVATIMWSSPSFHEGDGTLAFPALTRPLHHRLALITAAAAAEEGWQRRQRQQQQRQRRASKGSDDAAAAAGPQSAMAGLQTAADAAAAAAWARRRASFSGAAPPAAASLEAASAFVSLQPQLRSPSPRRVSVNVVNAAALASPPECDRSRGEHRGANNDEHLPAGSPPGAPRPPDARLPGRRARRDSGAADGGSRRARAGYRMGGVGWDAVDEDGLSPPPLLSRISSRGRQGMQQALRQHGVPAMAVAPLQ